MFASLIIAAALCQDGEIHVEKPTGRRGSAPVRSEKVTLYWYQDYEEVQVPVITYKLVQRPKGEPYAVQEAKRERKPLLLPKCPRCGQRHAQETKAVAPSENPAPVPAAK